ncbi:MAG: M14 family metallopeptidase [Halofilum sp. (in: g-proteobacteria)]
MTTLHEIDHIPNGLLETPAPALHRILPGPTLIHLPGERPDALFVSVLQHGNEDTGLLAVQRLLAAYEGQPLPRALSLFIGNVEAARHARRHLDHQVDFNRAWPGTEQPAGPETRVLAEVFERLRARSLFASVDIHNTSGSSPHHVGVNSLDPRCLQLAHRFSRTIVHFTRPRGAQAQAFLALCPAVILECGRVGSAEGVPHARDFLAACLDLDAIPEQPPAPGDLDLFDSVAMVTIPASVRFGFEWPAHDADPDLDLCLPGDIDRLNFRELAAGTVLGRCRGSNTPVAARDPAGADVTAAFFECRGGQLRLRRTVMPSLLTPDARIIRQDCLCHLMERIAAAT